LSSFNVEVPILWVRTGNSWVRFEPIKRLEKTLLVRIYSEKAVCASSIE